MKTTVNYDRGFSLIEILVVIAIISILSLVAMASFTEARANARDKTRISDLEQAKAALHIYAVTNKTYQVAGAGSNGQGWFTFKNGSSYPKSIAEELVALGILSNVVQDPLVNPDTISGIGGHRPYMIYFHNPGGATKGVCLFTQLERPSDEQLQTVENAPIADTTRNSLKTNYKMSYASCTQ